MSTLQMERGGSVFTPSPAEHRVPDHVPVEVAAEHPDAANVVARQPHPQVQGSCTVRAVDRAERRSRSGFVLALAACALVAALASGSGGERVGAPVTTVTAGSTTTATPNNDEASTGTAPVSSNCPSGTSVVVQCGPTTCAPLAPWSPFFGPCGRSRDVRR